ncbi:MAG: hypothetical protein KatS3mg050_2555 [Litorilinea sp.]|nr:MAG: hypothetical protein KatS3mg050_2555 [Litorilinea sp.]
MVWRGDVVSVLLRLWVRLQLMGWRLWRRRQEAAGGKILFALALVLSAWLGVSPVARVAHLLAGGEEVPPLECESRDGVVGQLPRDHYLYSERYGWFDTAHFATGDPAQVIRDVHAAVARGGDQVVIQQGLRGGITGYTAYYWVSGRVPRDRILGVALGIYLDWSRRFEAWQNRPPRALLGPFTPFAIEDLPSQYVGFYASAHRLDLAYVLACYLDEMEPTDEAPPRLTLAADLAGKVEPVLPGIRRLVNRAFTPLVPTPDGWRRVPWPKALRMMPVGSASGLWHFVSEETWYFDAALVLAED